MKQKKAGFTLMEMLIVVLIMGILASIALPQYQQAVAHARFVGLMPMLKAVKDAQEEYWLIHRQYASTFSELGFHPSGFTSYAPAVPPEGEGEITDEHSWAHYNDQNSSHYQNIMRKGEMTITLDRNGNGAPGIWARLRRGGQSIAYFQYLDKVSPNPQWAHQAGQRYCYSYTNNRNDWRYKLCASMTKDSAPASGWGCSECYRFNFKD